MILILGLLGFFILYVIKYLVIGTMICYSYFEDWRDKRRFEENRKNLNLRNKVTK